MLKNFLRTVFLCLFVFSTSNSYSQTLRLKHYCLRSDSGIVIANKSYVSRDFDTSIIKSTNYRYLRKFADSGYPFCRIDCDSLLVRNRKISVYSTMELGGMVTVLNIFMVGQPKISDTFIYNQIGMRPGSIYSESAFANINNALTASGFISLLKPTEIEYHKQDADIYVYLGSTRKNSVSALAALVYDESRQSYSVTGNATLDLRNNFGRGERLFVNWLGYGHNSQLLDFSAQFPYVGGTRMSAALNMKLTKTDSLCLNTQIVPKLTFRTGNFSQLGIFANIKRLIPSSDDIGISDTRQQLFGLENIVSVKQLHAALSLAFGNRKTDYGRNSTFEVGSTVKYTYSILPNLRYELDASASAMVSSQRTDIHENYMVGGANSLRGFSENSLYCTRYMLARHNVRLLAGGGFSVFGFCDMAAYTCDSSSGSYSDTPMGFGFGLGLKIMGSDINLAWALPRENKETKPIKQSKIHISMVLEF